jgi:RNA polymerase sigma-70 factor (sigma-E family)
VDAEADFRAYVAARIASLSRVAYLLTGDWHAAEDLVQLALINVARHWERVSATGDPDAYVRRVLYHQHVSVWRQRRRTARVSSSSDEAGLPGGAAGPARDGSDDVATAVVVQAALAKLTRKQRAVLVLRFFEDRTEAETAEVLRCSVSTVKSQTRDALARIRVLAPELHELVGRKVPQ